jgi:hypothetical protein
VIPSFIVQPLPFSVFSSPEKPNEAPPVTDKSAAFADTETRAPANAVRPIFLMFSYHPCR